MTLSSNPEWERGFFRIKESVGRQVFSPEASARFSHVVSEAVNSAIPTDAMEKALRSISDAVNESFRDSGITEHVVPQWDPPASFTKLMNDLSKSDRVNELTAALFKQGSRIDKDLVESRAVGLLRDREAIRDVAEFIQENPDAASQISEQVTGVRPASWGDLTAAQRYSLVSGTLSLFGNPGMVFLSGATFCVASAAIMLAVVQFVFCISVLISEVEEVKNT